MKILNARQNLIDVENKIKYTYVGYYTRLCKNDQSSTFNDHSRQSQKLKNTWEPSYSGVQHKVPSSNDCTSTSFRSLKGNTKSAQTSHRRSRSCCFIVCRIYLSSAENNRNGLCFWPHTTDQCVRCRWKEATSWRVLRRRFKIPPEVRARFAELHVKLRRRNEGLESEVWSS